jgi:hypothetical protein
MLSIMPRGAKNPRMVKGWRDNENYALPHKRGVQADMTLYIGNELEDLLWRAYFKCTDDTFIGANNTRFPRPLPSNEFRSRVEVRIKGATLQELGLNCLGDLENFKFERLQKLRLFRFGKRIKTGQPISTNPYAAAAIAALCIDDLAPACVLNAYCHRDTRKRSLEVSRNVEVDSELTDKARSALRSLSHRFCRASRQQYQKSGRNSSPFNSVSPMEAHESAPATLITIDATSLLRT